MKFTQWTLLLVVATAIVSCNNDHGCSGNTLCTTEFVIINFDIVDAEGERVVLDSFTVTDLTTNATLTLDWEPGDRYPIADDSLQGEIPESGRSLEFVGLLNGTEVVRQTFVVGHDCCHVTLLDGPTSIQIQ